MRHKKGKICFSDNQKTIVPVDQIKKIDHEKDTIIVTLFSHAAEREYKIYLNYWSDETAVRDYRYTLVCLRKQTQQAELT